MRAVVTTKFGPPEVLEIQEVEKPKIKDNEILVRVYASSINPVDWKLRSGYMKILLGFKPTKILGADYSGIVTEVGRKVSDFKVGDAVFGLLHAYKGGAYAEFLKAKEKYTCLKPKNLNFEEAASIPLATLTSYQALVHEGKIKHGNHVMVNGCTGGVGIAGVQIAKAFGCIVTGVCSTKNLEIAKKVGVDHVIDYTKNGILKDKNTFDIFLDAVANQSFFRAKETLKPNGTYITTLPGFHAFVLAPFINIINSKKLRKVLIAPSKMRTKDLKVLKELIENGKLKPVIEKVYPIEQIREAHTRSETGRVVGKVVIRGFP
ncbi:MAG: NAD(P)-dependent alcohol dehydrogenase [Ignavibacteria bacterium]|nr:NAD(P)-dependent alcohol dehydrogenase [Ignavibacteria bacterium]